MWRPDFPFVAAVPAEGVGVSRRLCVWSATYRGSPERPGLVFGLDEAQPDARATGVLFDVAAAARRQTLAYLFQRELIYPIYRPAMIEVRTAAGVRRALAFVVDRQDPAYAGDLAPAARIAAIRSGAGRAGRARDYLANALRGLAAMGAAAPDLEAELAAADALADDDPARLFSLLDEGARRRLDAVFQEAHEGLAF